MDDETGVEPGAAAPEDEYARRLGVVDAIRAGGGDPYPVRFDRDRTAAELHAEFDALEPGSETGVMVRVAGRLLLIRRQGKLVFATLRDGTAAIQLFVSQGEVGEEGLAEFARLDLGDWVGVDGEVMTTRRGELSVKVRSFQLLAKSLRPLPDKWHGLSDVDTRFRRRYVDLIVNEEARRVFQIRFAAISAIRRFLDARAFVEVETPVLHPVPGGAAAKPFVTHHNALDMDLFLRIAPELYLKRLIVAGFERVYELGRVFRNEGLSTRHNPEFTMLEAYQAFADYTEMMSLTEELVAHAAVEATGSTTVPFPDGSVDSQPLDLAPPWPRRTLRELVAEHAGVDVHPSMPLAELQKICDSLGVPYDPQWGPGKLVLEIYEKTTEHAIVGPMFVLDYPREVSPLARPHRDDPALVERFEVIVAGRELANAFSELNDPVDQRRRFEDQAALAAGGDEEAQPVDEDYLLALEYGLPPTGGLGIGIDRLAMLLAGVSSIREVILFPHLRGQA
ncbi:MAG: lysyl-tRNA synthetase, class [Actinomycetota bacterium]|nr:lysyl-tRNA synthetase, class [Actinomycetota bacterium]